MAKLKKMDYSGDGTIYEIEPGAKYKLVLYWLKDAETGKRPRKVEVFKGTFKQSIKRIEAMHAERNLLAAIVKAGLNRDELSKYGLTDETIFALCKSVDDVKRELEKRKADEARRIEEQRHKITFSELSDEMLTEIKKHGRSKKSGEPLTKGTITDYRLDERHAINTSLGQKAIEDITESDVLQAVDEMRTSGLGDTSVHKAFSLIKRVFEYARKRKRLIAFNPVDGIEDTLQPRKPDSKRDAMPHDEWLRLIRLVLEAEPDAHKCVVLLAACNGLRLGECLGLSWDGVVLDAKTPYVHIYQQHTDKDGLHNTKTKNGHKTPLDAQVAAYLRRWAAVQKAQLNALGIERGTNTPVCTNAAGGTISTNNFETWWRKFSVSHGFGLWVDDNGKRVVELTANVDDAELYPDCVIEWRDIEGWPCDKSGRRYSRSYKRPKIKKHYKGVTPHVLRHTFFTTIAADKENRPSLKELQYLGGWTTPRMVTEVYTHADENRALQFGGMVSRMLSESVNRNGKA